MLRLGRAVIGGLLFATVATLFFVPSVFAIFHGRREAAAGTRARDHNIARVFMELGVKDEHQRTR